MLPKAIGSLRGYSGKPVSGIRLRKHQLGVTSIEYALIAALIAMAIVVSVGATGTALSDLWEESASKIAAAISGAIPQ